MCGRTHTIYLIFFDSAVVCFADFFFSEWATWEVIHSSQIDVCIITQMLHLGFFMRVDGCTLVYNLRKRCTVHVRHFCAMPPDNGKVIKPVYADVCLFMRLMVCSGGGLRFMKMG